MAKSWRGDNVGLITWQGVTERDLHAKEAGNMHVFNNTRWHTRRDAPECTQHKGDDFSTDVLRYVKKCKKINKKKNKT